MTSVPATLEAPVFAVDDATLLDGAASVWAVIRFASDLPATPETKEALDHARSVFLDEIGAFGFDVSDLEDYLHGFGCDLPSSNGRGSPPSA
jgi:hypothetical protein